MADPFRARRKPSAASTATSGSSTTPTAAAEKPNYTRAQLDDLRKPQLVELADDRGLDTGGTRADLIERLLA